MGVMGSSPHAPIMGIRLGGIRRPRRKRKQRSRGASPSIWEYSHRRPSDGAEWEARAQGRAVVPYALPHRNAHHVRLLWDSVYRGMGMSAAVVMPRDRGVLLTCGLQYSFGVLFTTMLPDLGWSRASMASTFSLYSGVYTGLSVAGGHLTDRPGPPWIIAFGGCCLGRGFRTVMTWS
jgi:hypothetical protein